MSLGLLSDDTLTVTRSAAQSYVDGVLVPGSTSTFEIEGTIQPMSGRELLELPEGERTGGVWKLYTESELNLADVAAQTVADTVAWDGKDLEVVRKFDLSHIGLTGVSHYKYHLREPEVG